MPDVSRPWEHNITLTGGRTWTGCYAALDGEGKTSFEQKGDRWVGTKYYRYSDDDRGYTRVWVGNFVFTYSYREHEEVPDTLIWTYTARYTYDWPDRGHRAPESFTKTVELPMRSTTGGKYWLDGGPIHVEKPSKDLYIPTYAFSYPKGDSLELKPWETPWYNTLVRAADKQCEFGDLSMEAAESVRQLDINSIAYLRDFAEIGKLAKSLTAFTQGPKTIAQGAKVASSMYLGYHYGARLTVKDTQKIADAIDNFDRDQKWQRIGAQRHFEMDGVPGNPDQLYAVDLRLSGTIDYFPHETAFLVDKMKQTKRALYELDLAPTLDNIWDMVPYSFVIDWFVPLGDAAHRLEMEHLIQTFNVQSVFQTRKIRWAHRVSYGYHGLKIEASAIKQIYHRSCKRELAIPPLRTDSPQGLSGHWVESTALLISKM
jgi:hypothetical protein